MPKNVPKRPRLYNYASSCVITQKCFELNANFSVITCSQIQCPLMLNWYNKLIPSPKTKLCYHVRHLN